MVSTVKFKQDNNRQPDSGRKKDKQKRQRRTATKAIKMACHGRLFLWKKTQMVVLHKSCTTAMTAALLTPPPSITARGTASSPDGSCQHTSETKCWWRWWRRWRKRMNAAFHYEKVTTIFVSFQKDNDGRKECVYLRYYYGTKLLQWYINTTPHIVNIYMIFIYLYTYYL